MSMASAVPPPPVRDEMAKKIAVKTGQTARRPAPPVDNTGDIVR